MVISFLPALTVPDPEPLPAASTLVLADLSPLWLPLLRLCPSPLCSLHHCPLIQFSEFLVYRETMSLFRPPHQDLPGN